MDESSGFCWTSTRRYATFEYAATNTAWNHATPRARADQSESTTGANQANAAARSHQSAAAATLIVSSHLA
jgi:hypothetical protein